MVVKEEITPMLNKFVFDYFPFKYRRSRLVNYYLTDNLIRIRIAIDCFNNKDKIVVSSNIYKNRFYVYDIEIREYEMLDYFINCFSWGGTYLIRKLTYKDSIFYLSFDNDAIVDPYIKIKVDKIKLLPIGPANLDDDYSDFETLEYHEFLWQ